MQHLVSLFCHGRSPVCFLYSSNFHSFICMSSRQTQENHGSLALTRRVLNSDGPWFLHGDRFARSLTDDEVFIFLLPKLLPQSQYTSM
mmetsp:Transcript_91621/g.233097  ORF Transcript_91621/g.233097 Transcript_91621/m.233097 type:complete len:88 (-) Transcript_91621:13-276(-)